MTKNLESKRSDSMAVANPIIDNLLPPRGTEVLHTSEPSPDQNGWQQSTGLLMSGLLIIGLLAMAVFVSPPASRAAEIGVSVRIGPPPLPVYVQPVCPGPGYIWTPGYWAYDPEDGYYWVPGTWVMAPTPGFLWTPGYWGWGGSAFIFHAGYWGPHVGFYGGIDYGFGYPGVGFAGGEWRGREFYYNRSVSNIGGGHVTNVYYRQVINNHGEKRVSYNGGEGGLDARPTPGEREAERDRHIEATSHQRQHEMAAHNDRAQFASLNHGRPEVAATAKPGEFKGSGVVRASRAGGPVEANPGHTTSHSSAHNPNPGGGTHPVMTAHQNSPAAHNSGTRQGATASGQHHSSTPSHHEVAHVEAPPRQAKSHQGQPQEHSSRSSGGGEKHEPEKHR